jgi:hypothetical protein
MMILIICNMLGYASIKNEISITSLFPIFEQLKMSNEVCRHYFQLILLGIRQPGSNASPFELSRSLPLLGRRFPQWTLAYKAYLPW